MMLFAFFLPIRRFATFDFGFCFLIDFMMLNLSSFLFVFQKSKNGLLQQPISHRFIHIFQPVFIPSFFIFPGEQGSGEDLT